MCDYCNSKLLHEYTCNSDIVMSMDIIAQVLGDFMTMQSLSLCSLAIPHYTISEVRNEILMNRYTSVYV